MQPRIGRTGQLRPFASVKRVGSKRTVMKSELIGRWAMRPTKKRKWASAVSVPSSLYRRDIATSALVEPIRHGIDRQPRAARKLAARGKEHAHGRGVAAPPRENVDEAARAQVGLHVHPGIHDKAATCERPVERHLAAIASQAGSRPHFDRLPPRTHQAPVRSDSAVVHAVMTLKVCWRHRRTAVFEIFRRPDHNAVVVHQLAHDKSRVLRWTDSNDDIDSLLNEVHHPIGQYQVD